MKGQRNCAECGRPLKWHWLPLCKGWKRRAKKRG